MTLQEYFGESSPSLSRSRRAQGARSARVSHQLVAQDRLCLGNEELCPSTSRSIILGCDDSDQPSKEDEADDERGRHANCFMHG